MGDVIAVEVQLDAVPFQHVKVLNRRQLVVTVVEQPLDEILP